MYQVAKKSIKKKRNREIEVVTSGSKVLMENAVKRLMESNKKQKVLQVPDKDFQTATKIMRDVGLSGTVKNISGSRRRYVNRQEIERARRSREKKMAQHYYRPYLDIWSIQL